MRLSRACCLAAFMGKLPCWFPGHKSILLDIFSGNLFEEGVLSHKHFPLSTYGCSMDRTSCACWHRRC